MSKILISKPYNLKELSNNYDNHEAYLLYLAYIKDNGYMMIKYTNTSIITSLITSDKNPHELYETLGDEDDANQKILIKDIERHLKPYNDEIKEYYNKYNQSYHDKAVYPGVIDNNKDIIEADDILLFLLDSLDDKYETHELTKVMDYEDKAMRELISSPVKTFKHYLKLFDDDKKYQISNADAEAKIETITHNIQAIVNNIKNTNKYYMYSMEEPGERIPVLDDDNIRDLISKITLGLNEDNDFSYYHQDWRGVYTLAKDKDGEITGVNVIAKIKLINAIRIVDPLDMDETCYIFTIYNINENREVTYEYKTKDELNEALRVSSTFYNDKNIPHVINHYLNDADVEVRYEAYKKGFYYINNSVVENTDIKDLTYTKTELKEAIELFNKMLENRSLEGKINDCEVYRFSLWTPFSFIFKQLGLIDGLYGLILIGDSQCNKSGAITISTQFYQNTNEEDVGETVSTVGSRLEENTFLSSFDECSHLFLLQEAINVIKRAVYKLKIRGVKNKKNNREIDYFKGLSMPVFLLNEPMEFADYIQNRYHRVRYTLESVISNEAKTEFNKEFMPDAENTKLKKLSIIGRAFADKMIKVIEDETRHNEIFDIESLTIDILKEISEEADVDFIPQLLEVRESDTDYDYDMIKDVIHQLNKLFIDNNRGVARMDILTLKNSVLRGDYDFITYHPKKNRYFIHIADFKKTVNKLITNGMIDTESLIKGLNLSLKVAEFRENDEDYKFKNINFKDSMGETVQGRGFLLEDIDVLYYIFNISLSKSSDDD